MFGSPGLRGVLDRCTEDGFDWYYCDHAYFERFRYFRVTRNAFQHDGLGDAEPERWESLGIPFRPWRRGGRHILVCPPDAGYARMHTHIDPAAWLADVLSRLRAVTDRPIRVRDRHAFEKYGVPLLADLDDAWALVTHASNAAVEAVIAGVPVFCLGECAALAMGRLELERIEQPLYPDREPWLWSLATNQWTLAEIAAGLCWRAIGR